MTTLSPGMAASLKDDARPVDIEMKARVAIERFRNQVPLVETHRAKNGGIWL